MTKDNEPPQFDKGEIYDPPPIVFELTEDEDPPNPAKEKADNPKK